MIGEESLWLNIVFGTLEDGGEMIIISAFAWYSHELFRQLLPALSIASPFPDEPLHS